MPWIGGQSLGWKLRIIGITGGSWKQLSKQQGSRLVQHHCGIGGIELRGGEEEKGEKTMTLRVTFVRLTFQRNIQ